MEFNFDTRKTEVLRSFKLMSFPLFRYSKILSQIFLYLFIISIFLTVFFPIISWILDGFTIGTPFSFILEATVVIISIFLLFFCILFFAVYLFGELIIKKSK